MNEREFYHPPKSEHQRPLIKASLRGFRGTCPACGKGQLFNQYAKVADQCAACGQALHHHRADDLPAYLVIALVGKIVVAGFITMAMNVDWSSWQHLALWAPITIFLSIYLLPKVKGAVVGMQWALKMHGFGTYPDYQDPLERTPPDE